MEEVTDPHTSTAPALEDLAPFFPGYEFEGFIAEGGMGWVYQARQISLDRPVAIKILQRELGADPEFRKSFEAEAKAMARLNHPNLIGVYDFGDADGLPYIIMEMVNGKSLHHSAYGRVIDPVQAGKLVSAISHGLAHAHKAGILHRDIKPGNILLDAEATPKVGDFGLAQPMDQKTGADEPIYGTPGYTAPEVYHRQGDHRADIFSLGVLLHELLIGKLPQPQDPPPSALCGCSREMDNIVARATNPNPELRYGQVEELADALEKAIANQSTSASSSRLVMPSAAPSPVPVRVARVTTGSLATPVAVAAATPQQPSSSALNRAKLQAHTQKKSPALLIGVICTVLALIVIVVIASSGGGGGEEETPKQKPVWEKDTSNNTGDQQGNGDGRSKPPREKKRPKDKRDKPPKNPGNGGEPEVVVAPSKPSPLDSLSKLKGELAGGARENFPAGVEARDGSHFVVADLALSWPDAKKFAEEHGAHLAVLPTAADRQWFAEKFPSKEPIWVGAGMAALDKWQWLDASEWDAESSVTSETADQRLVSMLPGGDLAARADAELLHVALQWRDDGSNPATTAEQLKRTAEYVKANGVAGARFPVGTRTYAEANSHFFNIRAGISWDQARISAQSAGGYLAVPSSAVEAAWIAETFNHLTGPDAVLWIGGFRIKDGPWQWLNREAWNHSAGWAAGAEPASSPNDRLVQRFGDSGGWGPSDGETGGAFGLLVEWSPPKKAATITSFDLEEWQAEVDGRFTALVQADIDAWQKENKAVIDRYIRNVERLGRKYKSALSGREGQDRIRDAIDDAVRQVKKDEKLLSSVPSAAPDEFHELQEKSEKSVQENDDDFEKKLKTHLAAYTRELAKKATGLTESGFETEAASLTERIALVTDSPFQFLTILGLEDPSGRSKPPEPEEDEEDDEE